MTFTAFASKLNRVTMKVTLNTAIATKVLF